MELIDILKEDNPYLLSNGQIRTRCPFRELHQSTGSAGKGEASMFLSPDINSYHCFSCKSKGRLTNLLITKYELDYFKAIELVKLVEYKGKKVDKQYEQDFFWQVEAPIEFLERNPPLKKEVLEHFKLGYHNGKIIMPMFDLNNNLLGVAYRGEYKGSKTISYSYGFEKDKYIYNYNPKATECTIVEGQTDLYNIYGFGYKDVMSTLGSNLSDTQAELLIKIPKIYLAYDSEDIAGVRGMERAYKKLYKYVESVEFLNFPCKDAGELTKSQWLQSKENPYSYAEFKMLTAQEE